MAHGRVAITQLSSGYLSRDSTIQLVKVPYRPIIDVLRYGHAPIESAHFPARRRRLSTTVAFRWTRPGGSGCGGFGEVEGQQVVDISIDSALRQLGEDVAQPR